MSFQGFCRGIAATFLAAGLTAGTATAAEKTIIVLDASGSMWGQIDGKSKIEIARDALFGVVNELDPTTMVGLMAYGHREKGVCSDIELIVEPQAGFTRLINNAVLGIKPKGKTPLTDAVRMAAEAMKHSEDKATVILITDGLETCDADPCALGRMLEETGVDFTAHVVGFGLSEKDGKEVACLAAETGGVYLPAGNADELVEALGKTVAAPPPEPELPKATLTAPDAAPAASTFDVDWEGPGLKNDRIRLYDPAALNGEGREIRAVLIKGDSGEAGSVRMIAPARPGSYELRYWGVDNREVLATRAIEITEADVSLDHDEAVEGAATFTVDWKGPGARYDRIEVYDPNALGGDGKKLSERRINRDNDGTGSVQLVAPVKPGDYQIRYWNGDNKAVLATSPIVVTEVAASLTFDSPAPAGSMLTITWDGPGAKYDEVYIWDPKAKGGDGKKFTGKRIRSADFDNKEVKLPVPAKPGTYEVRYWNGDNRTDLVTAMLEVTEVEVSLEFTSPADAGSTLTIKWEGPGARYDEIYIWDPSAKGGDGKKFTGKRIRNADFDNQVVKLPVPVDPGTYEVRYWNGDSRIDMASVPLEVSEVGVGLDFPAEVPAGSTLTVKWEGPGARYDEVYIWDPSAKGGDGKKFTGKRLRNADFDNQSVRMPVPVKPGTYEVRYWNGDSKKDLVTASVTVTEIELGLDAPESVEVETRFAVTWTGPGARYDEVQIVDAKGKRVASKRVRNDDFDNNKVTIKAPKVPGEYMLRYYNGDSKAVLVEQPLSVN